MDKFIKFFVYFPALVGSISYLLLIFMVTTYYFVKRNDKNKTIQIIAGITLYCFILTFVLKSLFL
jgi:hypothetical protein